MQLDESAHEAVETVGGLVMAVLGRMPREGDEVTVAGRTIRVERLDGRRVDLVRLLPPTRGGGLAGRGPCAVGRASSEAATLDPGARRGRRRERRRSTNDTRRRRRAILRGEMAIAETSAVVALFLARSERLGVKVQRCRADGLAGAVAAALRAEGCRSAMVADDLGPGREEVLAALRAAGVELIDGQTPAAADPAEAGVSRATFGVAETGSLGVVGNALQPRMATMLPLVHVAVLEAEPRLPSLDEAVAHLERAMGSGGRPLRLARDRPEPDRRRREDARGRRPRAAGRARRPGRRPGLSLFGRAATLIGLAAGGAAAARAVANLTPSERAALLEVLTAGVDLVKQQASRLERAGAPGRAGAGRAARSLPGRAAAGRRPPRAAAELARRARRAAARRGARALRGRLARVRPAHVAGARHRAAAQEPPLLPADLAPPARRRDRRAARDRRRRADRGRPDRHAGDRARRQHRPRPGRGRPVGRPARGPRRADPNRDAEGDRGRPLRAAAGARRVGRGRVPAAAPPLRLDQGRRPGRPRRLRRRVRAQRRARRRDRLPRPGRRRRQPLRDRAGRPARRRPGAQVEVDGLGGDPPQPRARGGRRSPGRDRLRRVDRPARPRPARPHDLADRAQEPLRGRRRDLGRDRRAHDRRGHPRDGRGSRASSFAATSSSASSASRAPTR